MFNFFGEKKQNNIVVKDKVWLCEGNKWKACMNVAKEGKSTVFAVWFDATYRKLETLFSSNGLPADNIFVTRELARNYVQKVPLIFAEHYPLLTKEEELYQKLGLSTVTVYSSLDEPIFTHFGGDKFINLIKQLSMKEDEVLEHPLISSSIKNAQEKIYKAIEFEQSANTPDEWFLKNLGQS